MSLHQSEPGFMWKQGGLVYFCWVLADFWGADVPSLATWEQLLIHGKPGAGIPAQPSAWRPCLQKDSCNTDPGGAWNSVSKTWVPWIKFRDLSLLCQPRLLPTAWLFPAALGHETTTVFWFFQINFSRIFLLTEIVRCLLVLFWFWTEFFKLPECREEDFPSLHHLCLWFLKELVHISSHSAWSAFCFAVFSLSAFPHCILLPIMI